jgi:conjugative transfer signal peptidase TraF
MKKRLTNFLNSMKISKISAMFLSAIAAEVALILWFTFDSRLVWNFTDSMPVGLYRRSEDQISKHSLVLLNNALLEQHNSLFSQGIDNGYFLRDNNLLKEVIAVAGDVVSVTREGIYINGQNYPGTAAVITDSHGNTLKQSKLTEYLLKKDELLVFGNSSSKSFDSRYFGIVKSDEVIATVKPILTLK